MRMTKAATQAGRKATRKPAKKLPTGPPAKKTRVKPVTAVADKGDEASARRSSQRKPSKPIRSQRVEGYEAHKVRQNNAQRQQSEDKREIGEIPPPQNAKRRQACERDFNRFLKTYFAADTRHPWSKVHMQLIETIELVVLVGAMLAMGIPRGW